MSFYNSKTYISDLKLALDNVVNIEKLKNSSIMITGATGLIGSFIVDMLNLYNELYNANIAVIAVGRSMERLSERFDKIKEEKIMYIEHDVIEPAHFDYAVDYIIHCASNAYPRVFAQDPVGTIVSNVQGTKNILDYGKSHKAKRFMFISTGEVYGEIDPMMNEPINEDYSGYINPLIVRSCYPASKRAAETLCVSYTNQYGLDTVITRPCHTYGPNATSYDNRASAQFINNALNGEDIVLKSSGKQIRSYCYIADCISGIMTVLVNGIKGEGYNIANGKAVASIYEFANIIASLSGCKVVFENANKDELKQRTFIKKQVLSCQKLENLGWRGHFSIEDGISHTLTILKESNI